MKPIHNNSNDPTPLVTILMPVYQGERYVRQAIESILNQTYSNLQLIIMDDCSTDSTRAIIDSFRDHRIEYHRREVRKGYPYADDMFEFIRGDYVTSQSHDDISLPERLEVLVNCVTESPDIDAVFEHSELIDGNDNPAADWALEFAFQNPATTQEEILPFMFAGHALPGVVFLKTNFLFNTLGGTLGVKGYEATPDYAANFRILKRGKIKIVDKVLMKFRTHGNNYSKTNMNALTETAARIISDNRRELSIEQIFPQILKAESEKEIKRLKALCHFQLAMYMNRYSSFRFVRDLVEMDLEQAIVANPAFADAWNALGVIRWKVAEDYLLSSYESLRVACQLANGNPQFKDNFQIVANRIGQDGTLGNIKYDLQDSLNKYHRIKTLGKDGAENTAKFYHSDKTDINKSVEPKGIKILVISGSYPPHHIDDDALLCQKVCHYIQAKQYSVQIVTSDSRSLSYQKFGLYPIPYPGIYRDLKLESNNNAGNIGHNNHDQLSSIRKHNLSVLKSTIHDFNPDIIITWDLDDFDNSFLSSMRSCNIPVIEKANVMTSIGEHSDALGGLDHLISNTLETERGKASYEHMDALTSKSDEQPMNQINSDRNPQKQWADIYKNVASYEIFTRMPFLSIFLNKVLEYCRNRTAIETGVGTGYGSIWLSKQGVHVIGIDYSQDIVERARLTNEQLSGDAQFSLGDMFDLGHYLTQDYDVIFHQGVLEHYSDEQIREILNQQISRAGYVIFSVPSINYPFEREFGDERLLTTKEWETILTPFKVEELRYYGDPNLGGKEHILCIIQGIKGGLTRKCQIEHRNINFLWNGPIYDPSGYSDEARNFVLSLDRESIPIRVNPIKWNNKEAKLPSEIVNKIKELSKTPLSPGFINVMHIFPLYFQRNPAAQLNIGRTMFETDRIPEEWVSKCNEMDEIWVPTDFNIGTFAAAGVHRDKLVKIPGPHDFSGYSLDVPPLPIEGKKGFSFLSTFDWNLRKGWDILIKAYIEEFKEDEDVTLILKVWSSYGKSVTQLQQDVEIYIREVLATDPLRIPDILFLDLNIPVEEMPCLYKAVDAYVMPTRGEGWGRPYIEAMAMGLPTIGTRWSGNTEFMNDENSFLIDFEMKDVPEEGWREIPTYKGHRWAEPSVPHLRSLMRHVYECRGEAREKGMHAREDVLKKYNGNVVAEKIIRHIREIDRKVPSQKPKISICWEGSQFIYHSLALINREVGIELLKKEQVELSIIPYESHQFDETADPRYPALARSFHNKLPSPDIHIRHQWPPNFNPPPNGHWVLIQPWEFGSLPKTWIPPIQNLIDEVWIPSHYVRQVYIDSGITPEKVHVIPNGINPEIFNPDGSKMKIHSRKGFKFLFVGGTIYRKGIDILINTYLKTFTAKDDVVLVIKDIGSKSFYSGQNLADEIKKIRKNPKAPAIYYIEKDLTEREMASLYRACDCLVHPYRGEGFGLPVLEAMACSLPVIVTAGGSTDDFVEDNTGYRVPSRRIVFGNRDIGNLETVSDTWFLEIDRNALQEQMRYVMTHPDEARAVGQNASGKTMREFTWQRVADKYLERMHELLKKPLLRKRT